MLYGLRGLKQLLVAYNKMKNKTIMALLFVCLLVFTQGVSARSGVGLYWEADTLSVHENTEECVEYKVYNPWEDPVNVMLNPSDELEEVTKSTGDSTFVQGDTSHTDAIPVEVCFEVGNVYEDDCLLFGTMCKQVCGDSIVKYEGKILASEVNTEESQAATGSAAAIAVGAPMGISVQCSPSGRDFTFVYIAVIVVALALVGFILYRKNKRKKEMMVAQDPEQNIKQ